MKKMMALVLALVMVLVMTACGDGLKRDSKGYLTEDSARIIAAQSVGYSVEDVAFAETKFDVDSLTEKVEYTAEGSVSYGNGDACAGVNSLHTAGHTVGRGHGDTSYDVVTKLAGNLTHELLALVLDLNRVEKIGQMAVFKFDIKYGTDYLYNLTDILIHFG